MEIPRLIIRGEPESCKLIQVIMQSFTCTFISNIACFYPVTHIPLRSAGTVRPYPARPMATLASAITTPTIDSPPSTPDATTTPFSSESSTPRAAQTRS